MSQNLQTLLATAAELRAVGRSWDSIAQQVHRKSETCRQWPRRHKADWEFLYRAARLRRFEETSNEAHGHLHNLLRSKDDRIKMKAIEVWLKCGAGIYQKLGSAANWEEHLLDEDAGRRDCHRREQEWARYRKRLDAVRAARGQAPLTNEEFWSECRRLRGPDNERPRGRTVGPVVAGMAMMLVAVAAGWFMSRIGPREAIVGIPAFAGAVAQVRLKPGLQPEARELVAHAGAAHRCLAADDSDVGGGRSDLTVSFPDDRVTVVLHRRSADNQITRICDGVGRFVEPQDAAVERRRPLEDVAGRAGKFQWPLMGQLDLQRTLARDEAAEADRCVNRVQAHREAAGEWEMLLEELGDQHFWDVDYQLGDVFLDLPPDAGREMLEQHGIDPEYFLDIPDDPDDEGLTAARRGLATLTGRDGRGKDH